MKVGFANKIADWVALINFVPLVLTIVASISYIRNSRWGWLITSIVSTVLCLFPFMMRLHYGFEMGGLEEDDEVNIGFSDIVFILILALIWLLAIYVYMNSKRQ